MNLLTYCFSIHFQLFACALVLVNMENQERAKMMMKWAEVIDENAEEIATLMQLMLENYIIRSRLMKFPLQQVTMLVLLIKFMEKY